MLVNVGIVFCANHLHFENKYVLYFSHVYDVNVFHESFEKVEKRKKIEKLNLIKLYSICVY